MIEVRIRHEEEGKAIKIGDWPEDKLDEAQALLWEWTVSVNTKDDSEDTMPTLGHFVLDYVTGAAYFEIVVA